jgi:hypothetical protein
MTTKPHWVSCSEEEWGRFVKGVISRKAAIKRAQIVKRTATVVELDDQLATYAYDFLEPHHVIIHNIDNGHYMARTPEGEYGPSSLFEPILDQILPSLTPIKANNPKPASTRRRKSEHLPTDGSRYCPCGCDTPLTSPTAVFVPGHDGRMASVVVKLEKGEIDEHSVSAYHVSVWQRWTELGKPGGENHPKLRDVILSLR